MARKFPFSKNHLRIVTILLLGFLMLSQLVTGLNSERMSMDLFHIVHVGGGLVLVFLTIVHVALNWGWVKRSILRR